MVNCEGSSRNLKLTLESTQTFTEVYLLRTNVDGKSNYCILHKLYFLIIIYCNLKVLFESGSIHKRNIILSSANSRFRILLRNSSVGKMSENKQTLFTCVT